MSSIQYKIDKLLESKNLTKTAFAKAVGIHIDTVYNLKDKTIKVSTLLKISEVLGVPFLHFFEIKEDKITYKKNQASNILADEAEAYEAGNYKEKYYETLEKLNIANEKLNACNERVIAFTDLKKDITNKKSTKK